jgi:hypothetical protein
MLAASFDVTHHDVRGGVAIDYLTGEQVISRLLSTLGTCGWSFRILQHDIHLEADEVWVLGELRLHLNPDDPVVRQQFGSSKIKRARSTGAPLDIGFDLKSAATDCLKKCATLVGVGLYLTRKDDAPPAASSANGTGRPDRRQRPRSPQQTQTEATSSTSDAQAPPRCETCSQHLQPTQTREGAIWSATELAAYTCRQYNQTLCSACVRTQHSQIGHPPADSVNSGE